MSLNLSEISGGIYILWCVWGWEDGRRGGWSVEAGIILEGGGENKGAGSID